MARRESEKAPDKATEGLLQHMLRDEVASVGPCPDSEIAAAYFERSLDNRETAEYESHLSHCARCREQQAALALAHAPVRAAEDDKLRWAWLWDWRWLAPVTAMLVFAAIWYARRPQEMAQKSPETPYLAMSRSTESPLSAQSENESVPAPAPPPAVSSAHAANELKKAAPQGSNSRVATQELAEQEKEELAARKAAGDLASNLETDSAQKDTEARRRDAGAEAAVRQTAPPAAPPASASAAIAQVSPESSIAANAPAAAPAKTKQLQTYALSSRNATQAIEARAGSGLIRTPNPQILWRIASERSVERSIDGGATWTRQSPGAGAQLTAASAPADNICWLVGRGGAILLTTDAIRWKTIRPPTQTDFIAVEAINASQAAVTASDGTKFTTTDGGETWTKQP